MLYFQDSTHKTESGNSRRRIVFHLPKKPVGSQYLKVLRILVLPEILVLLEISAQFERDSLCSNEYFSRFDIKKGFSTYGPMTICNFTEKLAQNKYICVWPYNISSLFSINCPLDFWKVLDILLNDNSLIFKIPYNKVILTVIISTHSCWLY